jgi:hypothetical protein
MKHVSPVKLKILIQRKLLSQLLNEINFNLNVLTLDFVRCNNKDIEKCYHEHLRLLQKNSERGNQKLYTIVLDLFRRSKLIISKINIS